MKDDIVEHIPLCEVGKTLDHLKVSRIPQSCGWVLLSEPLQIPSVVWGHVLAHPYQLASRKLGKLSVEKLYV